VCFIWTGGLAAVPIGNNILLSLTCTDGVVLNNADDAYDDKIKISSLLIKHVMRTQLQIECSNKT